MREQGTTIFLTTHYLDEADVLCDRVAIIDHGAIVALDSPKALKNQIGNDIVILSMDPQVIVSSDFVALFSSIADVKEIIKEKDCIRLLVRHGETLLPQLLRLCDTAKIVLTGIALHHPTLDDVFLQKTGHTFTQDVE